jgi:RHH-type transcriptional regulator, rel operon repressor / antitoxin RelB
MFYAEVLISLKIDADCYTCIASLELPMLALRLPPEIEKRLDELAQKTGRTKSYYARKAIIEMIEDLEDLETAKARLAGNNARIPLEQILDEFAVELKS